ncbi:hypothetical protein QBC42DRAFT_255133 [Cladorrhinum samala]|uniref:DUF7730 domain-containing protein n=1 Tax=Cladorrhinum samala TaxID=585594 RepID=A0AAV9HDZ5_9PEZI|nr:hypothetical protein QBC42DRAFT_255133 [Cladorrhinum samala]
MSIFHNTPEAAAATAQNPPPERATAGPPIQVPETPKSLLDLSTEIRLKIFSYVLIADNGTKIVRRVPGAISTNAAHQQDLGDNRFLAPNVDSAGEPVVTGDVGSAAIALAQTSKRIAAEALEVFYTKNDFHLRIPEDSGVISSMSRDGAARIRSIELHVESRQRTVAANFVQAQHSLAKRCRELRKITYRFPRLLYGEAALQALVSEPVERTWKSFQKLHTVEVEFKVSTRETQGSWLRRLVDGLDDRVGGFAVAQVCGRRVTLIRRFDDIQEAVNGWNGNEQA